MEARTETKTSVVNITPKTITKIPSVGGQADLAQYLQVIPGVVFTGDQGGQLYIRGGSPIQNKVPGGVKANNSVDAGIDYIIAKIERGQFFVCKDCTGVLGEIWDYSRDENNQIVKVNDHYMDAMRYAIFSPYVGGVVMV